MQEAVQQIRCGDHIAFFYRNRAEQMAIAIPYIAEGLKRKEQCLYIADDNSVAVVLGEMKKAGINTAEAQKNGALTVTTKRDSYLKYGVFEPERMIQLLVEAIQAARRDGFTALRATGEMTWALSLPSCWSQLVEYESKLHARFPAQFIGLCQYSETSFSPEVISAMIRVHPKLIARGRLITNCLCLEPGQCADVSDHFISVDEALSTSGPCAGVGHQHRV